MGDVGEDEVITDLERFHQELQLSVGAVRDMVASWMPANSGKGSLGRPFEATDDFVPFKGRPERLGLGSEEHKSPATVSAQANPNSVEGRMIRSIMQQNGQNARKRKVTEAETSASSSARALVGSKGGKGTTSVPQAPVGEEDDDEEESRTRSISSKASKRSKAQNGFFHDKPAGKKGAKSGPGRNQAGATKESTSSGDVFVAPQPRGMRSTSGTPAPALPTDTPTSPLRLAQVRPPYALPANLSLEDQSRTAVDNGEVEEDGSESVATDITDSTLTSTVTESPSQAKKRRKRNKKKKKVEQGADANADQPLERPDMLFGDSVVD